MICTSLLLSKHQQKSPYNYIFETHLHIFKRGAIIHGHRVDFRGVGNPKLSLFFWGLKIYCYCIFNAHLFPNILGYRGSRFSGLERALPPMQMYGCYLK
jgi:hypothetical protein